MAHEDVGHKLMSCQILAKSTLPQKSIILVPTNHSRIGIDFARNNCGYSLYNIGPESLIGPDTSNSISTLQNHSIMKMINNSFITNDFLLTFVILPNNSYFDVSKWSGQYSNTKFWRLVMRQNLFTSKSLPYLIVLFLHDSTSFDPKTILECVILVKSKGPSWIDFIMDRF